MAYRSIELTIAQGIARVTLNQSEAGNPFNAEFCSDFCGLGNELSSRADVRVVLLKAKGKFFSVGGDIRMFANQLDTLPDAIRERPRCTR